MTNTQTRIAELKAKIEKAASAANPQREELAQLEAEQRQKQIEEQQRIRERELEWANQYVRKGNREDRTKLDAETKAAHNELVEALEASPIVQALARLSALEQRKQILADDMHRARVALGQQPNPVEHTMRFDPIRKITEAIDHLAREQAADDRDAREQEHTELVASDDPISDGSIVLDPTTLPVAERAEHGHTIERYTQDVEGYGAVKVLRDITTGETQIDDPAYEQWRAAQIEQGEDR